MWRMDVLQSGSLDLSYVQALGRLPGSLVGSPVSANCPLRPYLLAGRWRVSQVLGGAGQSCCPPGVWAPVFAWSRDSLPSVICHPPPCHVRSHEPKPLPFPDTPPTPTAGRTSCPWPEGQARGLESQWPGVRPRLSCRSCRAQAVEVRETRGYLRCRLGGPSGVGGGRGLPGGGAQGLSHPSSCPAVVYSKRVRGESLPPGSGPEPS